MKPAHLKMLAAGIIVAGAAGVLGVAGLSKGWVYYLPVDDFVQNEAYQDKRVRVHGVVSTEALQVEPVLLRAVFELKGETEVLPVEYKGIVPDQFQPGREVVVEGTLDEGGILQADTLLTKCASKYEQGEAPHTDPRAPESDG